MDLLNGLQDPIFNTWDKLYLNTEYKVWDTGKAHSTATYYYYYYYYLKPQKYKRVTFPTKNQDTKFAGFVAFKK